MQWQLCTCILELARSLFNTNDMLMSVSAAAYFPIIVAASLLVEAAILYERPNTAVWYAHHLPSHLSTIYNVLNMVLVLIAYYNFLLLSYGLERANDQIDVGHILM